VTFEFVRLDVLLNVHSRLLEKFGGLPGVRDENALGAAISRPQNLEHYGGVTSVGALGAALAWSILRGHPFTDGNKRTAFAGLVIFLDINGFELTCSEVEETAMVLRAASSEITEDEWKAWVERSIAALNPSLGH